MADEFFDKLGDLLKKKPWYELPRLLADGRLVEMRTETAQEEPSRHRRTARARPGDSGQSRSGVTEPAIDRRHAERSALPEDGSGRPPLRAQLSARAHVPGHGEPADSQSARGQQGTDDPRHVQAGDHPEPRGRRLAAVHGPRLVRAREIEDRVHRYPHASGRRLRRAERARAAKRARRGARRIEASAGLRQPQQPLVGCVADLRRRCGDGRESCGRRSAASSGSSRPACFRPIRKRA